MAEMLKSLVILSAAAVFVLPSLSIATDEDLPSQVLIENFAPPQDQNDNDTDWAIGAFPPDWKYRDRKATSIYGIAKDNDANKYFAKARSFKSGIQILKKHTIDTRDLPYLSWDWRLIKFPGEEKESDKLSSDNGASVYVIFSGFLSRTALKYTWSSYSQKGTYIDKRTQLKIFVLRDKTDPKNKWLPETRNIREDYIKAFGKEPPKAVAIAIMSDSDDTESYAEADYTDFTFKKAIVLPSP
jgi:hypothetical protein